MRYYALYAREINARVPVRHVVLWQSEEHRHYSLQPDTGRVWLPRGHAAAMEYLRTHTHLKARDLEDFLYKQNLPECEIPTRQQRRQWLYRHRQTLSTTGGRSCCPSVDGAQYFAEKWSQSQREGERSSNDIYVLPTTRTDETIVYIPFTCQAMTDTIAKYNSDIVLLGLDGKMKILLWGYAILSAGIIIKEYGKNSTRRRNAQGQRVQMPSNVCTFIPIMQAIVNSESKAHCEMLFRDVENLWNAHRRQGSPLFHESCAQIHKDFGGGSEAARKSMWPSMRSMDDWAHFIRNLSKRLPKGPASATLRKTVIQMLNTLRTIPNVDLFDVLAHGFLEWLRRQPNGASLARYLQDWYLKQVTVKELNEEYGVLANGNPGDVLTNATWWAGVSGCIPGSASGTQTVEAFHRDWETQIRSMGPPSSLDAVMARMQEMVPRSASEGCLNTSDQVYFDTCNSYIPRPQSQMHRLGVSTPEEYAANEHLPNYWVCRTELHGTLVVIGATAHTQISEKWALFVATCLDIRGTRLRDHLQGQFFCHDTFSGALDCRAWLERWRSSVIVFCNPSPFAARAGKLTVCSCEHWAVEGLCPHAAFAEYLGVPGHAAPRRNLESLPAQVRRGRRPVACTKRASRKRKFVHEAQGASLNAQD